MKTKIENLDLFGQNFLFISIYFTFVKKKLEGKSNFLSILHQYLKKDSRQYL